MFEGRRLAGDEALKAAGLTQVTLEPKEDLALINGTQLMTAVTGLALIDAQRLARTADVGGAMTLDALQGTDVAFDQRIHDARPHPGQVASARAVRQVLEGSALRASHLECGEVQDAYSLRCMPQVHGAVRDALDHVQRVVSIEMNAATDNPMVFAESGDIVSGGNFHGQPVAIAADILAIAGAELGSISERRTERLVNPALSGLPAFLARDGGLQSGLMMAHVTAAALVSESKALAHPASIDAIPTSAGKEDHVSMGVTAAHKAASIIANTRQVLAIELVAAAEALEHRRPLRSSGALEAVHSLLRRHIDARETDRIVSPDIEAAARLIDSGEILGAAEAVCGRLGA